MIHVAAASVVRQDGRLLLVRKAGATTFQQAGGKIEDGESPIDALLRELQEEVDLVATAQDLEFLGRFEAPAANEPGETVRAEVYLLRVTDPAVRAGAEIEELLWLDPREPVARPLAPLTARHVIPLVAGLAGPVARDTRATSFGSHADVYQVGRPEYPAEAVAWLLGDSVGTVVDVGAGTGKLTGAVAAQGRTVVAVDPDTGMLTALERDHPGVRTHQGSGESIPLPDGSAGAITFGQAWHWVDPPRAARECARVLTPGGVLGLIWNVRDDAVPWVRELTAIMHGSAAEVMMAVGGPQVPEPFGPLEQRRWDWVRPMTLDDVLAMASSRSHLITATPEVRERILAHLREFLASHPDTAGRDVFDMPYVTHAFRALRP